MAESKLRQIAFYGKGGIGKSTIVANISANLVKLNKKVLQIGCDPKHDSSRPFLDGEEPVTVIDLLRQNRGRNPDVSKYLKKSSIGVSFIEVGGPNPGVGCAGRGILKMFELLEKDEVLKSGYDVVIYDVLGDVVCGGFAAPMRAGYAKEVYIVVSGEYMALYAANNICRGIKNYALRREVRLAGIILNSRNVPNEVEIAKTFARAVNSHLIGVIPRDNIVSKAEILKKTVTELFPESNQAQKYKELTINILNNKKFTIPTPLPDRELEKLYYKVAFGEDV